MARHDESIEMLLDELDKYGLSGEVIDRSKHLEVAWQTPMGRRFIIAARTPSDWRSCLNQRAEVRRLLKQDGMQLANRKAPSFERAMRLPEAPRFSQNEKELYLRRDIDSLIDLLGDIQSSLTNLGVDMNTLFNRIQDVEQRMANARVESKVYSKIVFDDQKSELPDDKMPRAVAPELDQAKLQELHEVGKQLLNQEPERPLRWRKGSQIGMVWEALSYQKFKHVKDIGKEIDLGWRHVSRYIFQLSKHGMVEKGNKGFYRKTAAKDWHE